MPPKIVIRNFIPLLALLSSPACDHKPDGRTFNAPYEGEYLSQIAFPIGGMGAGMFCIEGNGTISHMSIHHVPELFNEPLMFAALHVKGQENGSKVIEGNVPEWKKYGRQGATLGISNPAWGFPRFDRARFTARFPFAHIELTDDDMPLDAEITAWSPFIPTNGGTLSRWRGMISNREHFVKILPKRELRGHRFTFRSRLNPVSPERSASTWCGTFPIPV